MAKPIKKVSTDSNTVESDSDNGFELISIPMGRLTEASVSAFLAERSESILAIMSDSEGSSIGALSFDKSAKVGEISRHILVNWSEVARLTLAYKTPGALPTSYVASLSQLTWRANRENSLLPVFAIWCFDGKGTAYHLGSHHAFVKGMLVQ